MTASPGSLDAPGQVVIGIEPDNTTFHGELSSEASSRTTGSAEARTFFRAGSQLHLGSGGRARYSRGGELTRGGALRGADPELPEDTKEGPLPPDRSDALRETAR